MARTYDHDDSWEPAELELIEDDERLPWLDSGEDAAPQQGVDVSRVLLLAAMSLIGVAALVGVTWLVLGASDDGPPADGSLIAAPEGPYKTKPEDAGGKEYVGTGDTSFAVGEGQTRVGRLADPAAATADQEIAGPSLATTLNEGPRASPPQAEPEQQVPSGTLVQVGAYPTRTDAQAAWARLLRQTEALNGVRNRIVQAKVDIGTVYRLQAVTGSRDAARSLCNRLKEDGLACFVK